MYSLVRPLTILLLALVTLAGCSLLGSSPDPAPKGVSEQLQAGQRREAILTLNSMIRSEPGNAAYYSERGKIYLALGSPAQAAQDADKALELDTGNADAWRLKAALLLSGKIVGPVGMSPKTPGMDSKTSPDEIAAARSALDRALEIEPQSALAYALRGRAERLAGLPEAALAELRHAEELDQSESLTYRELAQCYSDLNLWADAADAFDEAVALEPDSVDLLMSSAHAHWNIGEFGPAIDQLERAATLRSGDHSIFANLALVYAADKDDDEAIRYDSLARRKAALQNLRYSSPIVVAEDGKVTPALQPSGLDSEKSEKSEKSARPLATRMDEETDEAAQTDEQPATTTTTATAPVAMPEAAPVRDLMAEARKALANKNPDAALALISEYFDSAEPTATDYCFQARVLATLKEPEMAITAARSAIRTDPDDFCGYNNLGVITAASDPRAAIEVFNKGLDRLPNVPEMLNERGKLYLNTEQYELAEKDFDACVEADPNTPVYRLHRAIARYHLAAYDTALEDADKYLLMNPNAAEGYRTRAAIRGKLGQTEQAAKDMETAKSLQAQ